MALAHADRNLLFGILALQLDFIHRDQLVAAMHAWVLDKRKPLGQILVEHHALKTEARDALEVLVDKHLECHQHQPQRSLAVLSLSPEQRRPLDGIADPDLHGSLVLVPTTVPANGIGAPAPAIWTFPSGLEAPDFVGEPTSSGLRFCVLRPHAEGGLGKVSVARDRELSRDVALKEIKPEYAHNAQAQARFLCEAEITGALEHPGVVPVYGLGRHADGRPYYAMRFVQGNSLQQAIERFHATEWGRHKSGERALALRELLARFVAVCNAVAYAHSRGVVHRDIKPANALLGPYGETLLVDWGLAKLLKPAEGETQPPEGFVQPSSNKGVATQAGAVVGTPAYMAPEQASGGTVGPAVDVYGLGATLYHLLTGQPPFAGLDVADVLRQVAQSPCLPAREISSTVPAALSAVCKKAMAREPAQRYSAAKEVAAEVERWLADEPVSAYREPWPARLARWGRRHRPVVASAAALLLTVVLALAVGIVAVNREKKRTEAALAAESQARQRTRDALDEMSSQVIEDWLSRRGQLEPAQRDFLQKALTHYEAFAAESGHTEETRHSVADAYLRVGKIRYRLGHHPEAEAAYRRARQLYTSLVDDFPAVPRYRQQLALSHNILALLLNDTGHALEAEAAHRDALEIRKRLVEDFPAVPQHWQDLAASHNNLGNLLKDTGRAKEAEAAYSNALELRKRLATDVSAKPQHQQELALSHNNLGVLLEETGRPTEAEAAYRNALDIQKRLAADSSAPPSYRQELAVTYANLGNLLSDTGRPKEAEAAYRDAVALRKRLAADFPTVPAYRQQLARSYHNLGILLKDTGRIPDAEAAYREAVAILQRLAADFPSMPDCHNELANTLDGLAELAQGRKDYQSALQLLDLARPHTQAALASNPRHPFYRRVYRDHRQTLAATLLGLGEHASAAEAAADLAGIAFDPANDAYQAASFFARCMPLAEMDRACTARQRQELARSYGDRAVQSLRQAIATGYKDIAHLQKDKDLDSLRQRDDFKKLVTELEKDKSKGQ
jgi:serine/threonine-protein kinase